MITQSLEDAGRALGPEAERAAVRKAAAKAIGKGGLSAFAKETAGHGWNQAGLVIGGVGPAGNSLDSHNVFGWKSVEHLPHKTRPFSIRRPKLPTYNWGFNRT